eukprot:7391839-Prymnesium_polylepis.1
MADVMSGDAPPTSDAPAPAASTHTHVAERKMGTMPRVHAPPWPDLDDIKGRFKCSVVSGTRVRSVVSGRRGQWHEGLKEELRSELRAELWAELREEMRSEMRSELAELREVLCAELRSGVGVQGAAGESESTTKDAEEERDGAEKPQSAFCFAAELIMAPINAHQAIVATLLLTAITSLQAVFTFAFFDASFLIDELMSYTPYAPPLAIGNFYAGSSAKICAKGAYPTECESIPIISILSSLCGMILLCMVVRNEDLETLKTPFFLEAWLLSLQRVPPGAKVSGRLWRAFAMLMLLLCWCFRYLFVPGLVISGSAIALAGSSDAQSIVLNSIAAAFIMDIDNMAYEFVGTSGAGHSWAKAYMQAPPSGMLANVTSLERYSWEHFTSTALWLLNTLVGLYFYFTFLGTNDAVSVTLNMSRPFSNSYFMLAMFLHARVLVFIVSHIYLAVRQGEKCPNYFGEAVPPGRTTLLVYSVVAAVLTAGCSFFTYQVIYHRGFDKAFGSSGVPMLGSDLYHCLTGEASCTPYTIYDRKRTENQTTYSYASYSYNDWYGIEN